MTAREKFIARLKELGIYEQWLREDHVGAVLPDGSVVVLIHVETDPQDTYTEIHYPPYEEIRKKPEDVQKLKNEFYGNGDDAFVGRLAYWLDFPDEKIDCPLFPVDLYWSQVDDDHWFDYKDDDSPADIAKACIQEIADKFGLNVRFE